MSYESVRKHLLALIDKSEFGERELCRQAKWSTATLHSLRTGEGKMGISGKKLNAMAKVLGKQLDLSDLD
ncbi:MAG: hypothetical protein AAGC72_01190 [Planctomycetota bacterium]